MELSKSQIYYQRYKKMYQERYKAQKKALLAYQKEYNQQHKNEIKEYQQIYFQEVRSKKISHPTTRRKRVNLNKDKPKIEIGFDVSF